MRACVVVFHKGAFWARLLMIENSNPVETSVTES
jgi:hypothetical protein